jgi:VanZ family protein
MAAIFFASSQTQLPDLPAGLSNYTGHFIAYGALGVSALRAFAGAAWAGVVARQACKATIFASLYGVTDEVHQVFVANRSPGADDWVADTLGALTGVGLVLLLARIQRSRRARIDSV